MSGTVGYQPVFTKVVTAAHPSCYAAVLGASGTVGHVGTLATSNVCTFKVTCQCIIDAYSQLGNERLPSDTYYPQCLVLHSVGSSTFLTNGMTITLLRASYQRISCYALQAAFHWFATVHHA
jgi:hypothetical protein